MKSLVDYKPLADDQDEGNPDQSETESKGSVDPELQSKCSHPTKTVQYESKIVVEEEGRRSTQNIQISSTYTPSSKNKDAGEQNKSGNVLMETWISSEEDTLSDIDTTTFLHLNLLTELARSKCISKKRQSDSAKVDDAGPSEGADDEKPMKKARYSWQVKNLPERTQNYQSTGVPDSSEEAKNLSPDIATDVDQVRPEEDRSKEALRKRKMSPDEDSESTATPAKHKYHNVSIMGAMKKTYDDHLKTATVVSANEEGLSENKRCEKNSSLSSTSKMQSLDASKTTEAAIPNDVPTPTGISVQNLNPTYSEGEKQTSGQEEKSNESSSQSQSNQIGESNPIPISGMRHTPTPPTQDPEAGVPLQILRNRSRERPSRSYLQKLQHQHIAKSIVDNALNTTLEVLGFSPDNSRRNLASQRRRVEDDAVSAAIQSRGLQNHEPATSNPASPSRASNLVGDRDIDPIINQLTEFSENIFARNLQRSNQTRPVATGVESDSTTSEDELLPGEALLENSSSVESSTEIVTGEINTGGSNSSSSHLLAHDTQPTQPNSLAGTSGADTKRNPLESPDAVENRLESTSTESCHKDQEVTTHMNAELPPGNLFTFGDYLEDSSALQSDILDKAVAAAINQKGLGLEHL